MKAALARHIATVGTLAERLPAPGTTVGSLVGALLFWGTTAALPCSALVVSIVGLAVLVPLAVWSSGAEALRRSDPDPGPVVIDEVAGQWLALAVATAAAPAPLSPLPLAASFLLFRAFDVVKPWPIRRLERLPGGWGVVADDLGAGLAAGLVHAGFLLLA